MARKVKMRIWRGDSKNGDFKDVTVDANEGEVVLDVIHRVQATQMSDLAVRWNCKAGKCGSCSMEINGKPPPISSSLMANPSSSAQNISHPNFTKNASQMIFTPLNLSQPNN